MKQQKEFEKLNVIFLRDITTEAAYAKLSWLMDLSSEKEWIRARLSEPISGEMSYSEGNLDCKP